MGQSLLKIVKVESNEHLEQVKKLILEYVSWLGIDLSFQGFDEEFAQLPGRYAPPDGRLLLVLYDNHPAGCVGLRAMGAGICEIKRMYVRPAFRGKGIGWALANTIIKEAKKIGYTRIRLDTGDIMEGAKSLYCSLGFKEIEPYYDVPDEFRPRMTFMELFLK
jgi:carbonic anhydrase